MHECLGGLSLPKNNVVRLTDHPNMTIDVYRGRKMTTQQQIHENKTFTKNLTLKVTKLK